MKIEFPVPVHIKTAKRIVKKKLPKTLLLDVRRRRPKVSFSWTTREKQWPKMSIDSATSLGYILEALKNFEATNKLEILPKT
jgi:hypothetical protein